MDHLEIAGTVEPAPPTLAEHLDVRVRLEDTTSLDAPSVVIAETSCRLEPGPSARARFRLFVSDDVLDPRRAYTLSARGYSPGRTDRPRFGTVESYPVRIGADHPERLELRRLDQG